MERINKRFRKKEETKDNDKTLVIKSYMNRHFLVVMKTKRRNRIY